MIIQSKSLWVVLLVSTSCLFATNNQELFLRANQAYKVGNYVKALEHYHEITNKSGTVWYNIGNCLYHLNDSIHALVAYKKAQKRAVSKTQFDMIEQRIEAVYSSLSVTRTNSILEKIKWQVRSLSVRFSLLMLQLLMLMILYVFTYMIMCVRRRRYTYVLNTFLGFLLICLIIALLIKYEDVTTCTGIVLHKETSIYAGPDEEYHVLGSLDQASLVRIDQVREHWLKISRKGQTGWIQKSAIELIE